MRRDT